MHGCILSYEREREKFVQENILLHIAIIAGFTSQIMHIKKLKKKKIRKSNAIHIAIHTENLYKN